MLGASSAYAAGATGRGVTVAVVDTGIDVDHPEFAGAIAAGQHRHRDRQPAVPSPTATPTVTAPRSPA